MSLFNLYSASYPPKPWGTPPYLKQLYFYLIGFSAILVILAVDYQELHFWNYFFYIFVVGLLAAILIIGKTAGGAQRWISLGFFNLQPTGLYDYGPGLGRIYRRNIPSDDPRLF